MNCYVDPMPASCSGCLYLEALRNLSISAEYIVMPGKDPGLEWEEQGKTAAVSTQEGYVCNKQTNTFECNKTRNDQYLETNLAPLLQSSGGEAKSKVSHVPTKRPSLAIPT
jgi:hypothetical protein